MLGQIEVLERKPDWHNTGKRPQTPYRWSCMLHRSSTGIQISIQDIYVSRPKIYFSDAWYEPCALEPIFQDLCCIWTTSVHRIQLLLFCLSLRAGDLHYEVNFRLASLLEHRFLIPFNIQCCMKQGRGFRNMNLKWALWLKKISDEASWEILLSKSLSSWLAGCDQIELSDWLGWQKKLLRGKNSYVHALELLSKFKQVNLHQFSFIHVSSYFFILECM